MSSELLPQPRERTPRGDHVPRPNVEEARNPWVTTSHRTAYENPWITVHHNDVLDPTGRPGVYGVVRPKNLALGVLPIHDDGTTVLVGQFRYAFGAYSWEMPEGGGDVEVDPLVSIARELREETGVSASEWLPVCTIRLSNSISDELAHCWVAWGLTEGPSEPESTEELAVWRVPFSQLVAMVWGGEITDSMTVVTVAKVEAMRLRGELPAPLAILLGG